MLSLTLHMQLDVFEPDGAKFNSVPVDVLQNSQVQNSQHPLDELGSWSGLARCEFAKAHVAWLEAITRSPFHRIPFTRPHAALRDCEGDALRRGANAVCVERGATPEPPRDSPSCDSTTAATTTGADLELELERGENEGGAPGRTR